MDKAGLVGWSVPPGLQLEAQSCSSCSVGDPNLGTNYCPVINNDNVNVPSILVLTSNSTTPSLSTLLPHPPRPAPLPHPVSPPLYLLRPLLIPRLLSPLAPSSSPPLHLLPLPHPLTLPLPPPFSLSSFLPHLLILLPLLPLSLPPTPPAFPARSPYSPPSFTSPSSPSSSILKHSSVTAW